MLVPALLVPALLVRALLVRALLVRALLVRALLVLTVLGLLLAAHVPAFTPLLLVRPARLLLAMLCALIVVGTAVTPVTVPGPALLATSRLAVLRADAGLVLCTCVLTASMLSVLTVRAAAGLLPRPVDLRSAGSALPGAVRVLRWCLLLVSPVSVLIALACAPRQDPFDERLVLLAALVPALVASVLSVRLLIAA